MPHYRSMYESNGMLYACHLQGKDVTLTIAKVEAGTITGAKGKRDKKPVVSFEERKELKLALCKTNGKTIAAMYGTDTDAWIGKRITIYPTDTEFGGERVECIRVRPSIPPAARRATSGNGKVVPIPVAAPESAAEPDQHGDPPPPDDVVLP